MASHELIITTGDRMGAEAKDISVLITITDGENSSPELPIPQPDRGEFERGETITTLLDAPGVGHVTGVRIRRVDQKPDQRWFIEKMEFTQLTGGNDSDSDNESCGRRTRHGKTKAVSIIPVLRWINVNSDLQLVEFDSTLPQDEQHVEQREKELRAKREAYMLSGKVPGAPYVVEHLPPDENFSKAYATANLDGVSAVLQQSLGFISLTTDAVFDSLEDFEKVYRGLLPEPKGLENWKSDEEFGNQKVAGCNPVLLRLCTEIPEHMPVTDCMVKKSLEGKTIAKAIKEKKLYYIDLRYLVDIECSKDRRLPGPTCLFYSNKNKDLVPIAIQIMPEPAEDNPIFTPQDHPYTWLVAKMWFNLAECSHHQSCTHLGFTHLLMESFAVVTHRRLSQSHPIFKLLAPHFLFLMAINATALGTLINPGGWVDRSLLVGRTGMFNIIKKNWSTWDLHNDGNFVKNLKLRQVDDVEAIPNYPYRDDALLLWNAIERYVTTYVNGVYDTPAKLHEDTEIQAFAKSLLNDAEIKGVPARFGNVNELIEVLTVFIFIGSVQHAAANFGQYDEYAFPPNYPAHLHAERPKSKAPLTEDYVVASLPPKAQVLDVISITKLLSMFGTNELGNFEIQYAYDPNALAALKQFRTELKEIGVIIDKRNKERTRPYPYLHPKYVPNAISI